MFLLESQRSDAGFSFSFDVLEFFTFCWVHLERFKKKNHSEFPAQVQFKNGLSFLYFKLFCPIDRSVPSFLCVWILRNNFEKGKIYNYGHCFYKIKVCQGSKKSLFLEYSLAKTASCVCVFISPWFILRAVLAFIKYSC